MDGFVGKFVPWCLTLALAFAAGRAGAAPPPADAPRVVAEATKGQLRQLQGRYHDKDCGESINYTAEVVDLNGDGQPEVFVLREGTCLGGRAGVHVDLLVKGKDRKWVSQFGFPGGYRVLPAKHQGFPDIAITGPGNCMPVWRWDGSRYALFKRCR